MNRSVVLILLLVKFAFTYDPPVDTAGPLTVRIQEPMLGAYGSGGVIEVNQYGMAVPIRVSIRNAAGEAVSGVVRVVVIDRWRVEPASAVPFSAGPRGETEISFTAVPGEGTFNAHYPFHAFAEFDWKGKRLVAHPILILQTNFANPPRAQSHAEWKPVEVPANGALALWRLPVRRESATVSGEAMPGASGRETNRLAPVIRYGELLRRAEPRQAIVMTLGPRPPAMSERTQFVSLVYPLQLPETTPIRLRFLHAADVGPATFQVLANPLDKPPERVFDRRVETKTWQEAEADLTRFAGKAIHLGLSASSPSGAEALWGEPTVVAGAPAQPEPFPPASGASSRSLGKLANGYEVRLWPGRRGLLDSAVGFVNGSKQLLFRGFRLRVLDDELNDWRSASALVDAREEQAAGRYRVRHRFRSWAGAFDVLAELWTEGAALRARLWLENTPEPRPWLHVYLEQVSAGPWSETARRIYGGVGSVIEEPKAFRLSFDGHHLAGSYVGFDFANGMSMVQALDAPPTALEVDPEARIYSLNTPHAQTMTFLPSGNVWEAVKTWRDTNGLKAAGGVAKLAGRFVFDLWGFETEYAAGAAGLKKAFRYGLTDAAVVWHNWQRWGYDYRLPDIWPPNPRGGSLDEFRSIVQACKANGVYFAPHDNYIDFYPDAEGFSYDHIVFRRDGAPYKAWFMSERRAQSYRWRPDRVRPFLERNVRLIRDGLEPTAYFIDVWSSIGPYDYWTIDGRFVDRIATRRAWGEAFAWIREFLETDAPQISEAGHDQLIGWLDGAQANHLRVDATPGRPFVLPVACRDAERIPWLDAAHHDRFILHGAGYPGRYEGGLDPEKHGIYSDDYITTEVLTGHPAMVADAFSRDVVRKYWLLQPLMRALALRRIETMEFDGGDIHRQHVRWDNGAEVWVNRGKTEWTVEGHRLPEFGFYARSGEVEAAIETRGAARVEWSRSPSAVYSGGYRLSRDGDSAVLTPLPDSGAFTVRIRWADLPWKLAEPRAAEAIDEKGRVVRRIDMRRENGEIVVGVEAGVFAWRLR
jgi:hypothetical protein